MKKIYLILFCIFVISYTVFQYNQAYPINDDKILLKNKLQQFMNTPTKVSNSIIIVKQVADIDNKRYVVCTVDGRLSDATLIRGLNGKYKVTYIENGDNPFNYRIEKTNKSKYFVIFLKNYDMKIDYVKIVLDGNDYKISVPKQEYFIAFFPVPNNTKTEFPQNADFKLFDNNNIDITHDIYEKSKSENINSL